MTLFDALDKPEEAARPAVAEPLADQAARDLIRKAVDATLVVEAAAGTGKTTELVERMIAMLASGRATLDRMVAVTFTEAAAGELKLRLRTEIEKARLDETREVAARERLSAALPKLEEARISTIHGFCADLLREHPVEAGVDPRFEVASEDVARPLFERAFARWFEAALADPPDGVRRVLRRWRREPQFRGPRKDEGPRGLLRNAARDLLEHRDFPTPWRRLQGFDRDARIDALMGDLEDLAGEAAKGDPEDWFTKSLLEVARFVNDVRRAERVRPRDHDALEARLGDIVRGKAAKHWGWKGRPNAALRGVRDRRDQLFIRLKAFVEEAGADLAPRLRDELWPVVESYETAKARAGCLDFVDLLIRSRNLVRDHEQVRRRLQERFTHYFVDEFQDTDPLQVEILLLLAAADARATEWREARVVPGKLFVVGDPKQSIYRFRRADVALYEEVKTKLVDQGATLVHLTVSFRSVPAIQQAVNAAFAPRLGGPAYVPLAPFRTDLEAQPAVIALPVPHPYGDFGKIVEFRIEDSLPDVVAAWIDWLVKESGWTVTERESKDERIPVQPRHICILFRRFKSFGEDVTRDYVAALEARQLPHLLVGGSSFHAREEIEALRNALAAIERPDDEMSVFATLRGPLLALSDAALLAWRETKGPTGQPLGLHPFKPLPELLPQGLLEVAEAMALLRELHVGRNERPIAVTIARLLEATRAHAAFAIWPTGRQALANVDRLMDMARRAEQLGLVSFRAFVDRLEDEAERGEAAEAPLLEEGVEGVRIMTVHKAKGLEFPVVILADMTAKETLEQPLRWTDPTTGLCAQRLCGCAPPELLDHGNEEMQREREEAVRLLYVAATRARDVLVAPVVGDERREGWIQALEPALYPERGTRDPMTSQPTGCPTFGDDSTPGRPINVTRPMLSVSPGQHEPEQGTHQVTWWDPKVLALGVKATIGLSQTRILEPDPDGRSQSALTAWRQWRDTRKEVTDQGAKPTRTIQRATDYAMDLAKPVPGADAIEIIESNWRGPRPSGTRFGTLVHAVLATVPLDATGDQIAAHTTIQARLIGANEEEREAATDAVITALAHPLLRRATKAAKANQTRREAPVLVRLEDGTLLEAIADLTFHENNAWTVIDFKTDAFIPNATLEVYRRQTALYVMGIIEATGLPTGAALLKV